MDRADTLGQSLQQTNGLDHEVEIHTELERSATGALGTKSRQASTVSFPAESEIDARSSVSQQSASYSLQTLLRTAEIEEEQLRLQLQMAERETQVQLEEEVHL